MSDCRRCEDDAAESKPGSAASKVKVCHFCGAPATRKLGDLYLCEKHYVLALASQMPLTSRTVG